MVLGSIFGINIDDYTPDQVVSEGDVLTLDCHIDSGLIENKDWKICQWSRDSDDASCSYTYKEMMDGWVIEESCEKKG